MNINNAKLAVWSVLAIMAGSGMTLAPRSVRAASDGSSVARLQRLEDRQQIEELFAAYGSTLDRRDFDGFGRLFTDDASFGGGVGAAVHGRAVIQSMLQKQITSNPSHLPMPDFHLYFSPSIVVSGDHATATSKGAYVIPDAATNGWRIVFFVSYEDTLVRRAGHWLFASRVIHAAVPAAAAK
jgi:ketosteroid isomerase-like protein